MADHENNPPADSSELYELLDLLNDQIEYLHAVLDGFAEGRTHALSGERVRNIVYHALEDIDRYLKHLEEIRTTALPHLRRYVTAAMRGRVSDIRERSTVLASILHDIAAECHDRNVRTKRPVDALQFLHFIQSDLDSLAQKMEE